MAQQLEKCVCMHKTKRYHPKPSRIYETVLSSSGTGDVGDAPGPHTTAVGVADGKGPFKRLKH